MNDFFGPYFDNYLGPLFGDKNYSSEPSEPGTGTAMNGFFGPYFDNYFGPLFGNMEAEPVSETDIVTITGTLKTCSGSAVGDAFIVRQKLEIVEYEGNQQLLRRDEYVTPNEITGNWSVGLYPAVYDFIFRDGQSPIKKTKIVTESANFNDLVDYED